jgi:hypothetical protein
MHILEAPTFAQYSQIQGERDARSYN